jgi:hypothetical protein
MCHGYCSYANACAKKKPGKSNNLVTHVMDLWLVQRWSIDVTSKFDIQTQRAHTASPMTAI